MKPIKIVQLLIGVAITIFGAVATKTMLSDLSGAESVGYKFGALLPSIFVLVGGLCVVVRAAKRNPNA